MANIETLKLQRQFLRDYIELLENHKQQLGKSLEWAMSQLNEVNSDILFATDVSHAPDADVFEAGVPVALDGDGNPDD